MKSMVKKDRDYGLSYKKKGNTNDPYLPRAGQGKAQVCGDCRAVYMNKRWYSDEDRPVEAGKKAEAQRVRCPACQKIRDHFPGGVVTIRGAFVHDHHQDVLNLIRNEEARARGFNPLERVFDIRNEEGAIVANTTTEKMAQRLGRALKKAFNGEVSYDFSHDNKLARVEWVRE